MLNFESALRSTDPVYVINNTDPRGLLICTVNDPSSGRPHRLEFPRTWIPFCLTDMLPRDVLLHSIDLRSLVNKGVLKMLPAVDALELLNSEKGKKEHSRLFKSQFSTDGVGTEKTALKDAVGMAKQHSIENPEVNREAVSSHPKLKVWEQRTTVGEMDGATMANELETHAKEFTLEDLQYLLAGQFPQEAKDYAYEALRSHKYKVEQSAAASEKKVVAEPHKYEADWE